MLHRIFMVWMLKTTIPKKLGKLHVITKFLQSACVSVGIASSSLVYRPRGVNVECVSNELQ